MTALIDSILVNGNDFKTQWDARLPARLPSGWPDGQGNQRRLTKISPEGRRTFTFFDAKNKVIKDSTEGLAPVTHRYDSKGRRIEANQGGRKTTFEYDTFGRQSKVTDPLGRSTQFFYDGADRLIKTIAPDGSEVQFAYDRNACPPCLTIRRGNVRVITPPGRPDHTFDYSLVDLETLYTPPFAGDSARATARGYNFDKEIERILRPDSPNITLQYGGPGSLAGQPRRVFFDRGTVTNLYDTTKGLQIGVIAPTNDSLHYQYDGTLLKRLTWTGPNGTNSVKENVAFSYNSDLQVSTESVIPVVGNADSVNLAYDKDGMMTRVGALRLRYGTANNLLLSDTLGGVVTNYTYNALGELASKETKFRATSLFSVQYERDSLGRIMQKTETISQGDGQGIATKYNYAYDAVGRLSEVKRNDTTSSQYSYDQNANRLAKVTPTTVDSGAYDAQDRLLTYSNTFYFYTSYGDLRFRIQGTDTTRFVYDAFGSLVFVTLPNGDKIEYQLDGNGLRVGRKVNGVVTQKWLYSNNLRIAAELDSADEITGLFLHTTS